MSFLNKEDQRKVMRAKRATLDPTYKRSATRSIHDHLLCSDIWANASTILLYASTEEEFDTAPLISVALNEGKKVFLPKVNKKEMIFYSVCDIKELVCGYMDIKEPVGNTEIYSRQEEKNDLCIVPALSCDIYGGRIGYGGGYYDRFLRENNIFSLVPIYHALILDKIDIAPYDVSVDALLSENGFIFIN